MVEVLGFRVRVYGLARLSLKAEELVITGIVSLFLVERTYEAIQQEWVVRPGMNSYQAS